jgi:putative flippase GtrA
MRVTAFAVVGAMGFVVQLAVVAALTALAGWPAAAATTLGVEAAVLHNFFWHCQWTWQDRVHRGATVGAPLLRFHLANGATSLAGNVLLSIVLTRAGLTPVLANVAAVAAMSAANYALADRWAFGPATRPIICGGLGGR